MLECRGIQVLELMLETAIIYQTKYRITGKRLPIVTYVCTYVHTSTIQDLEWQHTKLLDLLGVN